jgi:hypothetical protein
MLSSCICFRILLTSLSLSSGNELEFDDKRLGELNEVSQVARDARHKLSQTLRFARNAEEDLRSKYGSLRASMRKSKLLVSRSLDNPLEQLFIILVACYYHRLSSSVDSEQFFHLLGCYLCTGRPYHCYVSVSRIFAHHSVS